VPLLETWAVERLENQKIAVRIGVLKAKARNAQNSDCELSKNAVYPTSKLEGYDTVLPEPTNCCPQSQVEYRCNVPELHWQSRGQHHQMATTATLYGLDLLKGSRCVFTKVFGHHVIHFAKYGTRDQQICRSKRFNRFVVCVFFVDQCQYAA
jgi:hypothetical protein